MTWGSEYYELHLEVCAHMYIFIGMEYSQESLKKYIPYNVIWKGEGGIKKYNFRS